MYYLQNEKWQSREEQGKLGKSSRSQWGKSYPGGTWSPRWKHTVEILTAPLAAMLYWAGDPLGVF